MKAIFTIKRGVVLAASIMAIGFTAAAHAQYVGPLGGTASASLSVASILKNPVDGQHVVLRGFLLKKVGNEKYLFSDGKQEIRVEIDDEDFPPIKIDDKTRIEIRGKVESDFFETPEIDVKRITLAP